jgi:chromosome segregation ATPase
LHKEADNLAAFKETKKIEQTYLKEKQKFIEEILNLKRFKERELNSAKSKLHHLKQKGQFAQRRFDDILKSISQFKFIVEELTKQNFENKKNLIDLKILRAQIPRKIKILEKSIKSNVRIIKSTQKDIRKIISKRFKVSDDIKSINYDVNNAEVLVNELKLKLEGLLKKEKSILERKLASHSVIGDFVKEHILFKKKVVKKKVAKKKKSNKK